MSRQKKKRRKTQNDEFKDNKIDIQENISGDVSEYEDEHPLSDAGRVLGTSRIVYTANDKG